MTNEQLTEIRERAKAALAGDVATSLRHPESLAFLEQAREDVFELANEVERLRDVLGDPITVAALRLAYKSPSALSLPSPNNAYDLYQAAVRAQASR